MVGHKMSFQAHYTTSLISSIKSFFHFFLSALHSACKVSAFSKIRDNIQQVSIDFVTTFSIFLLCLSFFHFSANHVVCIELYKNTICKSHLQRYHCNVSQDSITSGHLFHHKNNASLYTHVASLLIVTDDAHCLNCIDEHIQFISSSSDIEADPIFHVLSFGQSLQAVSPLPLLSLTNPDLPFLKQVPKPSYVDAVIRTTVLLI